MEFKEALQKSLKADKHTHGSLRTQQTRHKPRDSARHNHTEQAQEEFTPILAQLHTECESGVLDKAQLKPIGHDHNRLTQSQVRLDPYFEQLVCQQQHNYQYRQFFTVHKVRSFD